MNIKKIINESSNINSALTTIANNYKTAAVPLTPDLLRTIAKMDNSLAPSPEIPEVPEQVVFKKDMLVTANQIINSAFTPVVIETFDVPSKVQILSVSFKMPETTGFSSSNGGTFQIQVREAVATVTTTAIKQWYDFDVTRPWTGSAGMEEITSLNLTSDMFNGSNGGTCRLIVTYTVTNI